MKYDELKKLEELRNNGTITEEEFQREKSKILNGPEYQERNKSNLWGFQENTYIMLMHLSQFAGFIVLGLGFILPIVMWMVNSGPEGNANVDRHGKNIVNFMISMFIYYAVAGILCLLLIGIPLLIALGVMQFVFIIVATIKAANGQYWHYPMTITFLK